MQRHESRVAALERCEAHPGVDGRHLRTPSTRSQEPNRRRHAATRRLEAGLWRAGSRKVQAGKGRTGSRRMHAIRCHVSETGGKAGDDGVQTRARGRALGGGRGREQRGGRGTSGGRGGDGTQRTRRDETGAVVPRWWCGAVRCGARRCVGAHGASQPCDGAASAGAGEGGGHRRENWRGHGTGEGGSARRRRPRRGEARRRATRLPRRPDQRAPANARRKIQRRRSVQGSDAQGKGFQYSLFGDGLDVTRRARAHHGLPGVRGPGAGGRQRVARWAVRARVTGWALAVMMGHALRGEIALVHSLGAVLARRAPVLVDALGLALAAAHTGAAGPEGGRAHHAGGHGRMRSRGFRGFKRSRERGIKKDSRCRR